MKLVVVLPVLGLSCIPSLLPPRPPQPPSVVTALSFNLANGAGDEYRTAAQRAAQDLLRHRVFDRALDRPLERTRAEVGVEVLLDQEVDARAP